MCAAYDSSSTDQSIVYMNDVPPLDFEKIRAKIAQNDLNEYERRFLKCMQLMRREFMLRNAKISHKP